MNFQNLEHKIKKYTHKLKTSVSNQEAELYQHKLKNYHRIMQQGGAEESKQDQMSWAGIARAVQQESALGLKKLKTKVGTTLEERQKKREGVVEEQKEEPVEEKPVEEKPVEEKQEEEQEPKEEVSEDADEDADEVTKLLVLQAQLNNQISKLVKKSEPIIPDATVAEQQEEKKEESLEEKPQDGGFLDALVQKLQDNKLNKQEIDSLTFKIKTMTVDTAQKSKEQLQKIQIRVSDLLSKYRVKENALHIYSKAASSLANKLVKEHRN